MLFSLKVRLLRFDVKLMQASILMGSKKHNKYIKLSDFQILYLSTDLQRHFAIRARGEKKAYEQMGYYVIFEIIFLPY